MGRTAGVGLGAGIFRSRKGAINAVFYVSVGRRIPSEIVLTLSMPKRKEPELTPAEQYKRFKEAAKKAGATKDEEEFERVLEKVVPPKRSPKKSARTC